MGHSPITHINSISIASWNIHGFNAKKCKDEMFLNCISKIDICFLSETWLHKSMNYDVVKKVIFYQNAIKNNLVKSGRSSGGMLVMINKEMKKGIKLVEKNTSYGIWLKLEKSFFNLDENIYICGCYTQPEDSVYAIKDVFDTIENDISDFARLGKVVIMGDLNARTGNLLDYVINDCDKIPELNQIPTAICEPEKRINLDSKVNKYGKKLVQMCINCDMNIVNGRTYGDIPGQHTSFQKNGLSVTDYAVTSSELFNEIIYFGADNPTFLSDHSLIKIKLKVSKNKSHQSNSLDPIIPGYKWDQLSKTDFVKTLHNPIIQNEIYNVLNKQYDPDQSGCNEIGENVATIFQKTADLSLKRKKIYKNRPQKKNSNRGTWGKTDPWGKTDHPLVLGNLLSMYT